MLLAQIVRIPPLLPQYGATLDRRLRDDGGTIEIHVMTFPSAEALAAYRADPVRVKHLHLLEDSGAVSELFEATEVGRE